MQQRRTLHLIKNMFDLIKKRKRLTIPETQYFLYQLIDGLCYLHNKQIIHREYPSLSF